jgi:predicted DNA repair protein MutK
MSGLLALFDDVAAIAKLAATQLDDVAAQASKAGTKAAGVIIDDAAVTPKYATGLPAARELPIVWKIARASFFNKLVILLPVALLLDAFLPWMLTPLLMIGGAYLCFEGAEKVWHLIVPHKEHGPQEAETLEAAHLEEQRVKGAIKTDFILSAEIMTIALSQIDSGTFWIQAVALAMVAIGITVLVYGAVAMLVKADDVGLHLSMSGRFAPARAVGRGIVRSMPGVLAGIGAIGTVAMLWVGGSIIVHGLHSLGWHLPYEQIKHAAQRAAEMVGTMPGLVAWVVTAGLDGIVGLATGLALIPGAKRAIIPVAGWLFPEKS